jgi:poly(A) polymerase
VSGRGKLAADMREIWMMQPRFEKRVGSTPFGLVEQPRFRAGFDFLRLRADIEEVDIRLADWWQEFSMASDSEREDLVQAAKAEQQISQAAKPRVRRAPRSEGAPAPAPLDTKPGASDSDNVGVGVGEPKKRRRRRRKPGEGGDSAADSGATG